ncbi:ABC transporter ATP-binding protein [Nocardioides campestrisoli]|uniref:ABC transporter ATP-binding protein n=1 Tax=Nocardioides campestrisoli TaxID=2736757 RepID=UPI00163DD49F|nr:ABC transporter ATP-binding protein [Nocardioides campestrisoli]
MLEVRNLSAGYGDRTILTGIDLTVGPGEVVAVLGANGVGKSTLLRTLAGLQPALAGTVVLGERDLTRQAAHRRVAAGLSLVPEGQQSFPAMSVEENLRLGAGLRASGTAAVGRALAGVYEVFPKLAQRRGQLAGTLSGGERQMLAIGRALLAEPKVLMLDEPSHGLAPIIVEQLGDRIAEIATRTSVLVVEQNLAVPARCATRVLVLDGGRFTREGSPEDILHNEDVVHAYLGV